MRPQNRGVTGSGNESADEAGMTGPAGCGAEGAVPDCALVPFVPDFFNKGCQRLGAKYEVKGCQE